MSAYRDFNQNINQLVKILKKLLGDLPLDGPPGAWASSQKGPGMNINFCFFNFLEMLPEDLENYEPHHEDFEWYEDLPKAKWSDLDPTDLDFLKRNGIRF